MGTLLVTFRRLVDSNSQLSADASAKISAKFCTSAAVRGLFSVRRLQLIHFLILVLVFLLPLGASTFTATTLSANGLFVPPETCSDVSPLSAACRTSSSNSGGSAGSVSASANFEFNHPGFFGFAEVSLVAICASFSTCLDQEGTADAEVDLAIHGEPAGTPGLLEIISFSTRAGDFAPTGTTAVTGLTRTDLPGPHGGFVYTFTYDQPFQISATVTGSCSECGLFSFPSSGTAGFNAPFYVYDTSMNLVSTINSPLDAQPAPEPGTLTIMVVGLAFLARTARSKTKVESSRRR